MGTSVPTAPPNFTGASLTIERNPLNDLHRQIIMERLKRNSQPIMAVQSLLDKVEQVEAAKVFKDTIFIERQLECAKCNLA